MPDSYDSTQDTFAHIRRVQELLLLQVTANFQRRAIDHDATKMVGIEKEGYDELGMNLRQYTYGSEEYKAQFKQPKLKEAIEHHYQFNQHHPEHWAVELQDGEFYRVNEEEVEQGVAIARMSLFDLVEMVMDWKAASERHADGSITGSLPINVKRFGIDHQLALVIENTMNEMGW